jgi:SAM-dependent methyltransferase
LIFIFFYFSISLQNSIYPDDTIPEIDIYLMIKANDPIGQAISDFYEFGEAPDIIVQTNYTEDETIPPSWFFRNEYEMPGIEQKALALSKGKILDVGAAAGSHALALQKRGLDVTALEKSELAAAVMKMRGVEKVACTDIYHYHDNRFDTILVLMNGAGIGETLAGLRKLLLHLGSLLQPNGRILMDSSDIIYLLKEDDGSLWVDLTNDSYYGEMEYELTYKNHFSEFKWLFVDFNTLSAIAAGAGFSCTPVAEGEHYDYLVEIKVFN